ncbi:MAG TPA: DUF2188 domain-containing protein [Terriglobales bacterium]|nr:DUF2188 domain-containing protein [Terriglobales bacterium]
MKSYHITKRGNQWALTAAGGQRATLKADTKADLIQQTRQFADGKSISVKIHKADGTVQEERSYPRADDPRSSPG